MNILMKNKKSKPSKLGSYEERMKQRLKNHRAIMGDFEKANEKVHAVEDQWHYPIMTKFGFVPKTDKATGFVRSYKYEHPNSNVIIQCTTGASSDYWEDLTSSNNTPGYYSELEPYLSSLSLDT